MSAATLREDFDITVAGTSHIGLVLALALVRIFEGELRIGLIDGRPDAARNSRPPDPRAFAISAASRSLLDILGVWPELAPHAQPVTAIDITDSALADAIRPVLLSYDNVLEADGPASFILEAERLHVSLLAAVQQAPGVTLVEGEAVSQLETDATSICLGLANGRRLKSRLLVAADGRNSPVRHAAGIRSMAWAADQIAIVTTVRHQRPHGGRAVQHFLPGGPFAMLPLPRDRTAITWSEEAERGREILALEDDAFRAELEARFGHRLGTIELDGPRAPWPLAFHVARDLVRPRLALVGDAARAVHPIAGQGLNLGFRDVAALAELLARGLRLGLDPGDATILEGYQRWRKFDAVTSMATFGALNALFSNESRLLRAVRDVGLGVVERLPGLKQLLVAEAAGLTGEVPALLMGRLP